MIDVALRAILLANPAVAALAVGGVHQSHLPAAPTLPAAAISRITRASREQAHDTRIPLVERLFQVSCYGETDEGALSLADAVDDALDDYAGTVNLGGGVSETIQRAVVTNCIPIFEPEIPSYMVAVDVRVIYNKP